MNAPDPYSPLSPVCLQVELELESLKNQQAAAAADSSSLVTKEEVSILRYLALTHNLFAKSNSKPET